MCNSLCLKSILLIKRRKWACTLSSLKLINPSTLTLLIYPIMQWVANTLRDHYMQFTTEFCENTEINKMDSSLQESKGSHRSNVTANNVCFWFCFCFNKGTLRCILSQCCKQREWERKKNSIGEIWKVLAVERALELTFEENGLSTVQYKQYREGISKRKTCLGQKTGGSQVKSYSLA